MGYLTTVTIHNDAMHSFREDPALFGAAVLDCIDLANASHRETSIGFKGYCNYINSQPSRHADDHTVYVHKGNTVLNINPYCRDFKRLLESSPDILESYVKAADQMIKDAKKLIKAKKLAASKVAPAVVG